MSENDETGFRKNIDLLSGLVGLIFIIFVVSTAIISADNRDEYYSDNPDIVPGTFLFIGILLLTPLLFYGILLFANGIWALLIELVDRTTENPSQVS